MFQLSSPCTPRHINLGKGKLHHCRHHQVIGKYVTSPSSLQGKHVASILLKSEGIKEKKRKKS